MAEKKDDTFDFGFSAKKDKKKKKGGVFSFEEVEETPEAAPAVVEETPAEDDWASFATAGKKGKGKKAKGKTIRIPSLVVIGVDTLGNIRD